APRDLFEGDREVVLGRCVDHRRRELVESSLTEVVVVAVDLTRALGCDHDAGVVGVDVLEQVVDTGRDHLATWPFGGLGSNCSRCTDSIWGDPAQLSWSATIAVRRSSASSRSSLTTTCANSG